MKINKLHSASKIFERIKSLDAQIIEIDKYARLCAEGKVESSFELLFKLEKEKKVEFDEDGSIVTTEESPRMGGFLIMDWGCPKPKKEEDTKKISSPLSDSETLQLLGFLLQVKDTERKILMKQLSKLGIE